MPRNASDAQNARQRVKELVRRAHETLPGVNGLNAKLADQLVTTRNALTHLDPSGDPGLQGVDLYLAKLVWSAGVLYGCLLIYVVVAIDRRTIKAGRVGLVLDGAIALSSATLIDLGFKRGRKRAGVSRRLLHDVRVSAPDRLGLLGPPRR